MDDLTVYPQWAGKGLEKSNPSDGDQVGAHLWDVLSIGWEP